MPRISKTLSVLLAGSALLPTAALAQTIPPKAPLQIERPYGLEEIIVLGQRREMASTLAGLGTPLRELPMAVSIVPQVLIEDLAADRFRDLFDYIPGVSATEANGATGDSIVIRGFQTTRRFHLNGLRRALSYDNQTFDLALVQRVEVLKGPAGVEFGVVDPGGGVNFVTKKPLPEFAATAEVEIGSYQQRAVQADITGPLTTDLSFRLIGHAAEAGSFRDTLDSERLTVAPSLLYQYGEGNALLLETSYQKQDLPYDRGTFYLEGAGFEDGFAPIDRSFHEPDDSLDSEIWRFAAYWTQALAPGLLLNAAFDYTEDSFLSLGARNPNLNGLYIPGTVRWNGTTRTVQRSFVRFENDRSGWTGQVDLTGNAEFGVVELRGQIGYTRNEYEEFNRGQDRQTDWPIDAFDPVYGTEPMVIGTPLTTGRDFRFDTTIEETGLFAQATAVIADDLRLLAGVRRDRYDQESVYVDNVNIPARSVPDVSGLEDENTSWRIGASHAVADAVSVFAGYSVAHQPQTGQDRAGDPFEALEATSWEVGVKAEALGGIATGSFSLFTITQDNLAEPDPDNLPGENFRILVGEVETRGAELEGSLALTEALAVTLGVSYLDSEITRNLRGQQGNAFANTPEWQFSARAAYDWAGIADGLRTWAGLVHVDDRFGDNANRFTLPAYTRIDAGLSYTIDRWYARATVENVLDERYFLGAQNRPQNVAPGAPRTFTAAVGVRF